MWPFFPKKCNCPETPTNVGTNCNHEGLFAKDLVYEGNDIPCAEIYSGMNMSEVLQRLDYYLCGLEFTQQVLDVIQENPQEFNEFITLVNEAINCETISECGPVPTTSTTSSSSTTTTTSSSSTTTTTSTTVISCTQVAIDASTNCPGQDYALVQYTDCEGNIQTVETNPGELLTFCMLNYPPPIYLCGTGSFQYGEACFITTTTTSSSTSTTTSTTTASITTTTTTTVDSGCECNSFLVDVRQVDLDASSTGEVNVYVPIGCGGAEGITYTFTKDSEESICISSLSGTPTQYIIVSGNFVPTSVQPVNTLNCCVAPMPISSLSELTDIACGLELDNEVYINNSLTRVYSDYAGTTPFNGLDKYWKILRPGDLNPASALIDVNGYITYPISYCP